MDDYISYLLKLKEEIKNERQFMEDFHFFTSVERCFQISCQVIIDILNLIIIEEGIEKPEESREIISLLFNKGILSEDLAQRMNGVVGFRNILVHEYGKIDRKRIYKYLKEKIEDFQNFKKEIIRWLKSKA